MFTRGAGKGTEVSTGRRLIEEEKMASEDRLRELEEKYEDYKVYDNQGERIGKVDDLFVDETDREEYIGVKMGFFGMKSTLIPMDIVRVNEGDRSVEVSESKDHVKGAPSFDDDEDITPEFEDRIRTYFGLEPIGTSGGYGAYSDTGGEYADRESREHDTADHEASNDSAASTADAPVPEYGGASGTAETSEASPSIGGAGSTAEEATGETPTTRQTEETETFKEGGRSKIRRRIIREEIIEEDDPNARS
jgi:sporulation protein YlmC with PRC-barrel domain